MKVDGQRLRRDIENTATFGAVPVEAGRARTVLTGTEADREAREYLCGRLRDAGLEVRIDAVGNVRGRWTPAGAAPDAPPVAAGSHLDSVPEGGIFDGPLGVYAALEAVRALQDADVGDELSRPVDVISFTEEEGQRFDGGLIGSGVAAGDMSLETALAIEDDDGIPLGDALSDVGFRGDGRLDAAGWHAWLELHVEQAERLEDAGVPAGVVTTITGLTRCAVTFRGEADHAGTTPMDDRADALAAAGEFVLAVESAAAAVDSETTVGTVGRADVSPNAPNVIPGRVDVTLDVRDVDAGAVEAVIDRSRTALDRIESERPVRTTFERPWSRDPVPMSDRVRDALHAAGEAADVGTIDLHSGAAHDTMHVAAATDAALLFAPSRNGVSHSPHEWTDWTDCADATRVLAGAIRRLAGE
jgi:N-carbamoyl-L-amino-acid hydrolase